MCRFIDNDPSKYIFGDTLRAWVALVDAWMAKEGSSPGFILLFDMTGMQLSHLPRVNLALMAKFFFYLQVRLWAVIETHRVTGRLTKLNV